MIVSVYKGRAINGLILEHLGDIAEFYKKNQVFRFSCGCESSSWILC